MVFQVPLLEIMSSCYLLFAIRFAVAQGLDKAGKSRAYRDPRC